MAWFVYILRCADGSLYTGVSTDVLARVQTHNSSKQGARYTRSRRPVMLAYQERKRNKSYALRREAEIKSWEKEKKEQFLKNSVKKA